MTMKVCEICGAHLDPCEACDCDDKKAAPGGNDTQDGGMKKYSTNIIASKGGGVNAV